ncbi:MAG: orotidine-5'-phosphate decarboxylase [Gemmatimonadaceae bacterium]|nr:orotidine-5'-phosphate decarboxylase [Gemmatimonadaceae bacterium]
MTSQPSAVSRPPSAIVALDVPTLAAARSLVDRLGSTADFYKVGLQLYTAEGPRVVEWLHGAGKRVFLDLKLHDIPNTVRGAARSAAALGVQLLTVHAIGGDAMLAAAVEGGGAQTGILAVTVLTSMTQDDLEAARGHAVSSVGDEVRRLAQMAARTGAHGIVCAGHEVALVRQAHGDALRTLVPGIRLGGTSANDQARVMTPREAAQVGASYVVIGRTVTAAEDPEAAMRAVLSELKG